MNDGYKEKPINPNNQNELKDGVVKTSTGEYGYLKLEFTFEKN